MYSINILVYFPLTVTALRQQPYNVCINSSYVVPLNCFNDGSLAYCHIDTHVELFWRLSL